MLARYIVKLKHFWIWKNTWYFVADLYSRHLCIKSLPQDCIFSKVPSDSVSYFQVFECLYIIFIFELQNFTGFLIDVGFFCFYHFEEMTQCLLAYIVYVDKSSIYLFWILLYIIHFWLCLFIHLILNVLLALYMQTIYLDNIYSLTTCWWLRKWVKESEANSKTFKLYFLYKKGKTHETGLKSPIKKRDRDR